MNLQQFRATINRLQDLDSFPDNGDNKLHRIVKKQMAASDEKDVRKSKRSVVGFPETRGFRCEAGDAPLIKYKDDEKAQNGVENLGLLKTRSADTRLGRSFLKKLKEFAREKDILFLNRSKKNDPPNKSQNRISEKQLEKPDWKKFAAFSIEKLKGGKQQEEVRIQGEAERERLKGGEQQEGLRGRGEKLEECQGEKGGMQQETFRGRGQTTQQELQRCGGQQQEGAKGAQAKELDLVKEEERLIKENNSCMVKKYTRIPDKYDYRYYYECEAHPNGCLKLRHKRCPKGQFFSFKYLKCLKAIDRRKKSLASRLSRRVQLQKFSSQDDPEPSNEWLDVNQGNNQKIPPEFKPKKKPALKIYHLRTKRKLDEMLRNDIIENRPLFCGHSSATHRRAESAYHGIRRKPEFKHHLPRSFVIRVNKKEQKDKQLTENDENENDNDEEDEESEEEEEDEEADDEDEDGEEEESDSEPAEEKPEAKDTFRDFLRSAKAAVTNRARFEDPTEIAAKSSDGEKTSSSLKSKKSNESTANGKKVLIDASIKVDSALSSVLKSFIKNKKKDKEEVNGLNDYYETLESLGNRGRPVREEGKIYEHLMQNNPRVKRYFLANYSERGN